MTVERSPDVDAYIAKAQPFARPVLEKIRKAFHAGCPQAREVVKWGVPFFEHQGLLGGMAAFKAHVSFGFWKAKLLDDPHGLLGADAKASMCNVRATTVRDLPAQKVIADYVRRAAALNEAGVKPQRRGTKRPEAQVPADLAAALTRSAKARRAFEGFTPSQRREYVEWIEEAKRPATREKRLATTLEWLAEGKTRNWKYR